MRSVEGSGMGRGTQGKQDVHYRDFQEGNQGIYSRCVWGGLMEVEKIIVLDGGRLETLVNSCFEDEEGRMGLKSVWVFAPKAGKKR